VTWQAIKPRRQNVAASPDAERPRVLYVEDEDINWELTQAELETTYHLERAKSARETFERLRSAKFDLILMDIQLSGSEYDGIDITRIVKGKYSGTVHEFAKGVSTDASIVFVTAYSARYRKEELLLAGGVDMATKPINFTSLSLVMSRILVRGLR
jgi:CheY-like chemotaxis protein